MSFVLHFQLLFHVTACTFCGFQGICYAVKLHTNSISEMSRLSVVLCGTPSSLNPKLCFIDIHSVLQLTEDETILEDTVVFRSPIAGDYTACKLHSNQFSENLQAIKMSVSEFAFGEQG